jgi:hypothetical protein
VQGFGVWISDKPKRLVTLSGVNQTVIPAEYSLPAIIPTERSDEGSRDLSHTLEITDCVNFDKGKNFKTTTPVINHKDRHRIAGIERANTL